MEALTDEIIAQCSRLEGLATLMQESEKLSGVSLILMDISSKILDAACSAEIEKNSP